MSQRVETSPGAKVLYIDDEVENLDAFEYTLFDRFSVHTFSDPQAALEFVRQEGDLAVVVSDIKMPEMDGFEFLHNVSKINGLPVRLLLTGYNDERLAIRALNGQLCQGYFKKIEAFDGNRLPDIVGEAVERYVATLNEQVMVHNTTTLLKRLLRYKDRTFTHEHVHNVELLCRHLMPYLDLTEIERQMLPMAALFHDVGKLVVPDDIVTCTRGLTLDEYTEMKNHVRYGAELLKGLRGFERCLDAALDHHECYDGSGYPDGKKGKDISTFGRIVAVCDFFDALASERVYKEAVPHDQVLAMLEEGAGRRFDPEVVGVFRQMWGENPELIRHYQKQNEHLRMLKPSLAARDQLARQALSDVSVPREHLDHLLRTLRDVSGAMAEDASLAARLQSVWSVHSTDYFLERASDALRRGSAPDRANDAPAEAQVTDTKAA